MPQTLSIPFRHSRLRLMIFIMLMVIVAAIYKDPPPYFNSFYCNLGTKTMTDSGDYTCTSPRVIERADSFGLALVEFNKEPSANVWFTAEIITSSGVSLTSVGIRLDFKTSYLTKYGYMVLVIGYQPQNTWLDVINVRLPIDSALNQVIPASGSTNNFVDYEIVLPSWMGVPDNVRTFITSYGTEPISPATEVYLNLQLKVSSGTTPTLIPHSGSNSLDCGTSTTLYDHGGQAGGYSDSIDGYTVLNNQGSGIITLTGTISIESCCDWVEIYQGADTSGTLLWSGSGYTSIGTITSPPGKPLTIRFRTDGSVTDSGFQIQVLYSGSCSASPPCPSGANCLTIRLDLFKQQILMTMNYGVMVWRSSNVPSIVNLILRSDLDLSVDSITPSKQLDLYTGNQKFGPKYDTKCFIMIRSSKYATDLIFELFNSTSGNYYQVQAASTGAAQNIFDFFCLVDPATTVLGDFDYIDSLNGHFYSLGSDCPVPTSGFSFAQNFCQKCTPNYCLDCDPSIRTECTLCQAGYGIQSTGTCAACTSLYSNCITCSNNLPSTCTQCTTNYGIQPTGTCATCSSLFTNCLACSNTLARGCTQCSTGFGVSSGGQCQTCSVLFPNCNLCGSHNTGCTQCSTGYGITPSGTCQSCSVLYPNCNLCTSYNSGCTQCATQFGIDQSAHCTPCTTLYPNCLLCTTYNSGCSSCVSGFYQLILGTTGNYNVLCSVLTSCVPCSWIMNCVSCANGPVCVSCATGYGLDFLTLNRTCAPCTSLYKCLQCTDGPVCTACQPGFYLNSTNLQCLPCHFPCKECSLVPTNCTNCPSTQLYYFTGSNVCQLCSVGLPNCVKCDMTGTQCFQCNSTRTYLDFSTNKCTSCMAPCLDCLSPSQCLSCTSFSFLLVKQTFTCQPCQNFMPRCATCIKSNVCTACVSTATYFLTYPPDSCVTCEQGRPYCLNCIQSTTIGPECTLCADKYYVHTGACYACPHSCALCTSLIVCTSCINNFYSLQNQLCVLCSVLIPNCQLCSSATMCTKCVNGTIIDPAGSGTCINCTFVQYTDETNQLCQPCVSPCESCLNADDCLTCLPFREYIPAIKRCKDKCGDSIVITDQCDNGPGIFHDGCTDQCQKEPNYTCVNTPEMVSGQSIFRSVCSYDLPPIIKLFSARKEPFENSLTFTYLIVPYLFGLPGTTLRQFTQEELIKIFILYEKSANRLLTPSLTPGITVEQVAVDSSNSKVSLTFTYDRDIKKSQMELYIDFGYLKSTLALPNFATTPDSNYIFKVNSYKPQTMIGQFYTQEQYNQAEMLHSMSTAVGVMSFLAFLIGIFSKEVVGLEMAMLCQFTYLSLLFFQGTLELSFFALKGLFYSTGYNLPLADMNFQTLDQNPPQSFALEFDPKTFSNNFNLMTALYILPLVAVIPFIFLKAKCIRKISMAELGHKWVDLLLGETMLFCVLFNFQYLLFGMIAFYQDGRDIKSYSSSMIIFLSNLCTVMSFLGMILKPQIYGNFRMVFRYNDDLLPEVIAQRDKLKECEQHLMKKFQRRSRFEIFKKLWLNVSLIINENFLWRKYRRLHAIVTFNHYVILFVFFTLTTALNFLIENSELITLCLCLFLLLELIIARPYFEVSQKLRAIFFALIYTFVALVRYFNNQVILVESNSSFSAIILLLLAIALVWTFYTLAKNFYNTITDRSSDRIQVVEKVFDHTDAVDRRAIQEQRAMIAKLMKRYERVQLQYNVNNARAELLNNFGNLDSCDESEIKKMNEVVDENNLESIELQQPEDESLLPNSFRNLSLVHPKKSSLQNPRKSTEDSMIEQILKKAEEEKNFKRLRDDLRKIQKKKLKQETKNKVTGEKMLKLLNLDNFKKYEEQFLTDARNSPKKSLSKVNIQKSPYQSISSQVIPENHEGQNQEQKPKGVIEERNDSESSLDQKDEYESVDPKTLEEAEDKIVQEKILIEEKQYVRYERAREIISKDGLTINRKLIQMNYQDI